jgi:hypothetical protein
MGMLEVIELPRGQGDAMDQQTRPLRQVPDDFEVVFVEQGRLECEAWYRVRRTTVTRWLEEAGKARLIAKRAAYVKHRRDNGTWLTRASSLVEHRDVTRPTAPRDAVKDRRRVLPGVARRAAHYLRCVRNGGWIISPAGDGNWRVGTRVRSAAEMVDLAERKGFDRRAANLQARAEDGDN